MYKLTKYTPKNLYKLYVKLNFYTINIKYAFFLQKYFVALKKSIKFAIK